MSLAQGSLEGEAVFLQLPPSPSSPAGAGEVPWLLWLPRMCIAAGYG